MWKGKLPYMVLYNLPVPVTDARFSVAVEEITFHNDFVAMNEMLQYFSRIKEGQFMIQELLVR